MALIRSRRSGSSGGTSRKETSSKAFQTTGFVAGCSILPLDSNGRESEQALRLVLAHREQSHIHPVSEWRRGTKTGTLQEMEWEFSGGGDKVFQAGVHVCVCEATEGCQSMTKGRHQSAVGPRAHLYDRQEWGWEASSTAEVGRVGEVGGAKSRKELELDA